MTHAIATLAWLFAAVSGTNASTTEATLCAMVNADVTVCDAEVAPPPPTTKTERPPMFEGAQRRISNGF